MRVNASIRIHQLQTYAYLYFLSGWNTYTRNVSYNKQISLHILSWTTGTFHRSPSSIHFEYSCYLKRLHFDTRITSLDTIRKDRSIRTTTYISSYNLVVIIPLTIFEKNTYQLKICGLQPYNWLFAITSSITSVLSQSRSVLVFSDTPKTLFFCQRRIHFRSIPHVYATFNFRAQSFDWGGKSWRIYHSSWSSQTNQ